MSAYRVVPFRRWHLAWVEEVGATEGGFYSPDTASLATLERLPNMWTLLYDDVPLSCGGIITCWPGRHECWAYLNRKTGRHMAFVTRVAKGKLLLVKGRLDFTVRRDFGPGHRWARMLDFYVEQMPGLEVEKLPLNVVVPGQMRAWGPEGEDHVAYVRFN